MLYIFRSKGRKTFVDTKLPISLNKQCKLLNISKSSLYYLPVQKVYYPNKSRQHFQISYSPLTLLLYETATTFSV